MGEERSGQGESVDLYLRRRAYESLYAVLCADHGSDGAGRARDVARAVLDEAGIEGLAGVSVELSLKLAAALERIAADQGLAAADLAEIWFGD
ncbi:hypothetical protein ACFQE5_12230 [Pseudonocardia hispaniensis]|uniref:Uncharacterized protein n=1 Tax=Pseudonocardia hispaniensis TaxID=904933 RepID=A0ABW1J2F0_9PSEU